MDLSRIPKLMSSMKGSPSVKQSDRILEGGDDANPRRSVQYHEYSCNCGDQFNSSMIF